MVKNDFLDALCEFTRECVGDLLLPERVQGEFENPKMRPAEVFKMRLPDSRAAKKKAPYIIHQILTSSDAQTAGRESVATVTVRSIFCVYCGDEEQGALMLLELMERLRISLLRCRVLQKRYQLDLREGPLECLIYPDDTAPYFAGEMSTVWRVPAVEREVAEWLT